MNRPGVDELVSIWRDARDRGTPPTIAVLCRDSPELARPVAERIAAMGGLSMDLAGTVAIASAETSRTGDPPTPPVSSLPASLGGYRVERILGQGGMGAVCLAHDERLGRMVALKTMKPEIVAHPGAKDRFLREARAAAQVEHDNIIPVWQVGEDAGIPFIAMPLMQGESLACRLERERVSPLWVILKVGREVAEGLTAAHAHGLIHRDIKPGNVWLEGDLKATDPAARFRRCKILDFGLVLPAHDDTHLTASGITVGTPAYMSPEQAAGHALDFRTDLFSLGVLLYRMATGDQPFAGPSAMAVLTRLAVHNPPHPATKNPVVPTAVSDLIMRLLAKDPAGRPESARDVATTLRQIARERAATRKTGSAAPVTCPPPPEADAVPVTAAGNMVSDPGTEAFSPQLVTAPVGRRVRSDNTWKWMAAALLAVAAVVAAGVVIIKITGPDGKETTIEVPDGSIVKVDPKGRVDLELPKDAKTPAKPAADLPPQDSQAALRPASADLDRSVAEWVLERGGKVYLKGHGRPVAATRDLPTGPFILIRVMLEGLGDKVTDAGLERLTGLTGLTHLSLARTAVTDAALEHIKELVTLNDLRLGKTEVTDAGLKHLKGLKELTNLSLIQNPGVTGAGLAHLRGLDQLHELDLDATKVTDAGLTHLKGLSRLSHLGLVGTAVTDAGLTHLKGLSRLSHLGLMGTALTDAGLDDLRGLTALTTLSLDGTAVTDTGLEKLKTFPALTALGVSSLQLTDAGLEHLQGMTKLTSLVMGGPRLTDAGLKHLKWLDKLTVLGIQGSGVTDAGLEHLKGMTSLAELHLTETNVTRAGVENLRKALPQCKIVVLP